MFAELHAEYFDGGLLCLISAASTDLNIRQSTAAISLESISSSTNGDGWLPNMIMPLFYGYALFPYCAPKN
ncbi:MAG: hypothetical protein ABS23_10870 [SAR92 bacterium BACL16 MAG-120619-bin48]|nr:MAG: hypothetical protein ABS23_10870 [SAR92 bacterium BACL16 MAG-120619-bin48]